MSMLVANRQKALGFVLSILGVSAFALMLMQAGMSAHLLKIFNISYADAFSIVTAIINGTISALPTSLQPLATAIAGLVNLLYKIIGLQATITF